MCSMFWRRRLGSLNSGKPRGKGENERGGGAREEWRRRARVWRRRGGLVGARGQVERGPGVRCRAIAFRRGRAVTKDRWGPATVRERESKTRGWAVLLLRARGGRRLGQPTGWPGCLPLFFSFFF